LFPLKFQRRLTNPSSSLSCGDITIVNSVWKKTTSKNNNVAIEKEAWCGFHCNIIILI